MESSSTDFVDSSSAGDDVDESMAGIKEFEPGATSTQFLRKWSSRMKQESKSEERDERDEHVYSLGRDPISPSSSAPPRSVLESPSLPTRCSLRQAPTSSLVIERRSCQTVRQFTIYIWTQVGNIGGYVNNSKNITAITEACQETPLSSTYLHLLSQEKRPAPRAVVIASAVDDSEKTMKFWMLELLKTVSWLHIYENISLKTKFIQLFVFKTQLKINSIYRVFSLNKNPIKLNKKLNIQA